MVHYNLICQQMRVLIFLTKENSHLIQSEKINNIFGSFISKNKVLLQLPNFFQPQISYAPVNFPSNLKKN